MGYLCEFAELGETLMCLTLLLGLNAKIISEALGHSSVAFTLSVQGHIIERMQRDAMDRLSEVIPKVSRKSVADSSRLSG